MPLWAPPTPPQDDNDIYIDHTVHFLYEVSAMTETQLPPVYVRKEHKKPRMETVTTRKQKQKKEEQLRVPRSLFDRPTAALLKMRREQKMMKLKQGLLKQQPLRPTMGSLPPHKPVLEPPNDQNPEWTIFEDWALLQAVQTLLNLPLNLTVVSPAHTPNWDMVSEVVNGHNAHHRTAKQCRARYENTIIPREEGRILYDISPRKQKKTKGIYKTKNNRPMRTSQLFLQEGSNQITELHCNRFDVIRQLSSKRQPALRQTLVNPNLKNPKHLSILQDNGIDHENPLTPVQVAANRAERIAREKKQTQSAAAAAAAAERQAAAQQGTQQTAVTTVAVATSVVTTATAATPMAVTAQQLQPLAAGSTAVLVGAPDSLAKRRAKEGLTLLQAVATNLRAAAAASQRQGGTPYITTLASSGQVAQLTPQVVASQPHAPSNTTIVTTSANLNPTQRIATITGPAAAAGLKNINILRQSQSIVRGQGPQAQKLQATKLSMDPQLRQQPIKRMQTPLATQKVITQYNLAPGPKKGVVRLPDHAIEALKMQQLRQKAQPSPVSQQIMAQVQMTPPIASSSQPMATLVKSVTSPAGSVPNVTIPVSINVSNQQKVVAAAASRATVSQLHQQQQQQQQHKLHILQQQQRKVPAQLQAHKMPSLGQLPPKGIPLIIPNQKIPGQTQLTQHLLQQIVKQQQQHHQGLLTGVTTHGSQPTIIVSQNPPAGASATATAVVPKASLATAVPSSQIQTISASAPITVTQVMPASVSISAVTQAMTSVTQALVKAVSAAPGVSTVQLHTVSAASASQQQQAVQRAAAISQSLMTTSHLAQQQQQQVSAHPSPASTPTQSLTSPSTPTTIQTIQVQAATPPQAASSPTLQSQLPGAQGLPSGGAVSPSQQPKASPYAMRTRNQPKHS